MQVNTATFEVKPEALNECVDAIEEFVSAIEETEPRTLVYRSLRDTKNPSRFLHIFLFADEGAKDAHASSDAVKRFTDILYPNTLAPVEFTEWEPVAMVDRLAQ